MKKTIISFFFLALCIALRYDTAKAQEAMPVLNHIALSVRNLEKSTVFYRDVLQLDTIPEPFQDGKHTWFQIGPHSQLHLIEGTEVAGQHHMATHLCFSVPTITDFIERLNHFNIPFVNWQGEKQQFNVRVDGIKQLYLQDPNGYWIEINDEYGKGRL